MVEIKDIKDRESLVAWLNALPRETEEEQATARGIAVSITFRTAARALPYWWDYSLTSENARKLDLTALPVLRSLLISPVAAFVPTEDIRKASFLAAAFASDAARSASASRAASAAASAARASSDAASVAAFASSDAASAAAADAARAIAASATAAIWENIRIDAKAFWQAFQDETKSKQVFSLPLWQGDPPNEELWTKVQNTLRETGQEKDWAFWIDWYNRLLTGTALAPDHPMMVEIALLPNEIWQDEPAALKRINEIWQSHLSDGLSREEIHYDPERDNFASKAPDAEYPDRLEFAVQRLTEIRGLVEVSGNLGGALRGEMFLISNAVDQHKDNAAMVWNNARSALSLLQGNIASGGCPNDRQEPVVGLVETALVEVTSSLRHEPAVQKVIDAPVTEADAPDTQSQEVLNLAAYAVAEVMEPELAAETKEAAELMTQPGQSKAMRAWAATRVAGRIMGVWLAARYQNLKSARDETVEWVEQSNKAVGGVASIAAKSAVAGAAVTGVLYSDKIAAAVQAILKLAF